MYSFQLITQEQAEEIAFNWHYDGKYAFYNMEADEEDLTDFLDREKELTLFMLLQKTIDSLAFLVFIMKKTTQLILVLV